jgi:solute carrier family 25 2-oxodicarboxylate transporter 21
LASVFSGFTEALIINPSEVLKVRLQVDLLTPVENVCLNFYFHLISILFQQKSMATVAREIIREHGFFRKGLYSGFSATLMRDGIWNFFYFGIYHHIKHLAPDEQTSPVKNVMARLFLGFLAGSTASIMNIPFDVAKSRIQSKSATDPKQRYFHTWQTIQLVRREEGFTALYRGFVPRG